MRLPAVLAAIAVAAALWQPALAQAPPPVTSEPAPEPVPAAPLPAPSEPAPVKEPAETPSPGVAPVTPPLQWTEWDIDGTLIDDAATVRAVLAPAMQTLLTDEVRRKVSDLARSYGYHLIRIETIDLPRGVRAVLHLQPIPVVRRVDIDVKKSFIIDDDEILRRMRLRPSTFLEWEAGQRQGELDEETRRIAEYLREEGYFEAVVHIRASPSGAYGMIIHVEVKPGPAYHIGTIRIDREGELAIDGDTIRKIFRGRDLCQNLVFRYVCDWWAALRPRFTRSQHQAAIQRLTEMFRNRGYPAVKVTTDFDPLTSFDRNRDTVDFTVHVDQRRHVDVVFEGNQTFPDEDLRKQLTFAEAGSADEFEVANSAVALQAYYQARGYFDAVVSWHRESFRAFDRIVYRIDERAPRQLRDVHFHITPSSGDRPAIDEAELRSLIAPRYAPRLLGSPLRPSTASLAGDIERLRTHYRERGYGLAEISVRVASEEAGLDSAAMAGALIAAGRGRGGLHVRFDIDEGPPTMIDEIRIRFEGEHRATCAQVLARIGNTIGASDLAGKATRDPCTATGVAVPALRERLERAGDQLADWFWDLGRPRAEVGLLTEPAPPAPSFRVAELHIKENGEVRLGKVLVRGNFRTRPWVIRDELGFDEGTVLTGSVYAKGPRQLRTTNLFNAVNVNLVNFEETEEGTVNAVVLVEERSDAWMFVDFELGYSSQKEFFLTLRPTLPNVGGMGIRIEVNGTVGIDSITPVYEGFVRWSSKIAGEAIHFASFDGSVRFPRWLARRAVRVGFDTELAGFLRRQDTERFGFLETLGASVAASRLWQRAATETSSARSFAATLRYDFRLRNRDDEALRPAGADLEQSRVPVPTWTGAVGVELTYDRRTDLRGNLSPLTPQRGYQLQGGVSFAHPLLGSQDSFLKFAAAAQFYRTLSDRVLFRLDGRYDHGYPLYGALLLPEVERFFAGGDTTVRGYEEDRLATEIIETGVPPFGGLTQIRVLPAGGNIRALASADVQIRVARVFDLPLASSVFLDAGVVRNAWDRFEPSDIRAAIGVSLVRILTPVGSFAIDYAVPVTPRLGDNPLGRLHISVALRN